MLFKRLAYLLVPAMASGCGGVTAGPPHADAAVRPPPDASEDAFPRTCPDAGLVVGYTPCASYSGLTCGGYRTATGCPTAPALHTQCTCTSSPAGLPPQKEPVWDCGSSSCGSASPEAGPGDSGTGVDASGAGSGQGTSDSGSGCYTSQGTGQAETCAFYTGTTCVSPATAGTCPSGFVGCCGEAIEGVSSYACYYDPSVASAAKSACTSPDMWLTSLP
jgi:hypothetical protein